MKKQNKHPTPTTLPASVYDDLIQRLTWLHEIDNLEDVSLGDHLRERIQERDFTAAAEIDQIEGLLAVTPAHSVLHAFMQVLIVGSQLPGIVYDLEQIAKALPAGDRHYATLGTIRRKVRSQDAALWSAIELFRKDRHLKPLLGIIGYYHMNDSPFSDAGEYREIQLPAA